jgi:membrane protease YdiL (CAAX protease family)
LVDLPRLEGRSTVARNSAKYQLVGLVVVILAMSILFLPPATRYFVLGVFVATPTMALVTFWLTRYRGLFKKNSPRSILVGIASAVALYAVFFLGNNFIKTFRPLGIGSSGESSIYSTIGSHPLYLQIIILALDAFGFESYFRGTLQNFLSNKVTNGKAKVTGVFLAALCDALIHTISLNLLWVVTTFVADSIWGLTYLYTKDLRSSMTSHLVWDLVIFVIAPIK